MIQMNCPCGHGFPYTDCCAPYHQELAFAPTAEKLMRSRYSAFVVHDVDYLYETTHPSKRNKTLKRDYLTSAKNTRWVKLELIFTSSDVVEFKAYYLDSKFQTQVLHERSNFRQEDGRWYYVDGVFY